MSSAFRSYSQIGSRVSFLLSLSGCQVFVNNDNSITTSVLNVSDPNNASMLNDLSFSTVYGAAGLPANTLLRDMGRSLSVYANDANGRSAKVAVLREVQVVNGAATEGVGDTTPYMTPVWVDSSTEQALETSVPMMVLVARCG